MICTAQGTLARSNARFRRNASSDSSSTSNNFFICELMDQMVMPVSHPTNRRQNLDGKSSAGLTGFRAVVKPSELLNLPGHADKFFMEVRFREKGIGSQPGRL